MSGLALWTGIAVAVLVIVPPVIFGWFLRDAVRLMRELRGGAEPDREG